jgi:hypothetical protein
MRKYVLVCCVLMFSAALLGSAIASQETTGQETKMVGKVQIGEAVSIDAAANLIVIKDDAGAEVKLLISPATKITREGKKAVLADVKPGDKVTSECEESADGCKAKTVQATGPKPS